MFATTSDAVQKAVEEAATALAKTIAGITFVLIVLGCSPTRLFLTTLTKNAKILQNWLYHPFLALYMGTKELRSHIFYS